MQTTSTEPLKNLGKDDFVFIPATSPCSGDCRGHWIQKLITGPTWYQITEATPTTKRRKIFSVRVVPVGCEDRSKRIKKRFETLDDCIEYLNWLLPNGKKVRDVKTYKNGANKSANQSISKAADERSLS